MNQPPPALEFHSRDAKLDHALHRPKDSSYTSRDKPTDTYSTGDRPGEAYNAKDAYNPKDSSIARDSKEKPIDTFASKHIDREYTKNTDSYYPKPPSSDAYGTRTSNSDNYTTRPSSSVPSNSYSAYPPRGRGGFRGRGSSGGLRPNYYQASSSHYYHLSSNKFSPPTSQSHNAQLPSRRKASFSIESTFKPANPTDHNSTSLPVSSTNSDHEQPIDLSYYSSHEDDLVLLWDCPLCMEEVDEQDKDFKPCECGYQVCRFCWHHIKSVLNDKCPACRRSYTEQEDSMQLTVDSTKKSAEKKKLSKEKSEKLPFLKEDRIEQILVTPSRPGAPLGSILPSRKHLIDLRVLQPNLVYVIGIPLNLQCYTLSKIPTYRSYGSTASMLEEIISSMEYFGQYGHLFKVVLNLKGQHVIRTCTTTSSTKNAATISAFLTYERKEEASLAIEGIDGKSVGGYPLRATYGTTKYCAFFLRGQTCPNQSNCLYLHELGEDVNSYTKEALSARQRDTQLKRTLSNGTEIITHSFNAPPINKKLTHLTTTICDTSIVKTEAHKNTEPLKRSEFYKNIEHHKDTDLHKDTDIQSSRKSSFNSQSETAPDIYRPTPSNLSFPNNTFGNVLGIELPHTLKPSLFPIDQIEYPSTPLLSHTPPSGKLIGSLNAPLGKINSPKLPFTPNILDPDFFDPLDPSNDIKLSQLHGEPLINLPHSIDSTFKNYSGEVLKVQQPFARATSRFDFVKEQEFPKDPSAATTNSVIDRFTDLSITNILDQHPSAKIFSPSATAPSSSNTAPASSSSNVGSIEGYFKNVFPNINVTSAKDQIFEKSSTTSSAQFSNPQTPRPKGNAIPIKTPSKVHTFSTAAPTQPQQNTPTKSRVIPGYVPVEKKKENPPIEKFTPLKPPEIKPSTTTKQKEAAPPADIKVDNKLEENLLPEVVHAEDLTEQIQVLEYYARLKQQKKSSKDSSKRPQKEIKRESIEPQKREKDFLKEKKEPPIVKVFPNLIENKVKDDNIFAALLEDEEEPIIEQEIVIVDDYKPVSKKKKKKKTDEKATTLTPTDTKAEPEEKQLPHMQPKPSKKKKKNKKRKGRKDTHENNEDLPPSYTAHPHAMNLKKSAKELAFEAALHPESTSPSDDEDEYMGPHGACCSCSDSEHSPAYFNPTGNHSNQEGFFSAISPNAAAALLSGGTGASTEMVIKGNLKEQKNIKKYKSALQFMDYVMKNQSRMEVASVTVKDGPPKMNATVTSQAYSTGKSDPKFLRQALEFMKYQQHQALCYAKQNGSSGLIYPVWEEDANCSTDEASSDDEDEEYEGILDEGEEMEEEIYELAEGELEFEGEFGIDYPDHLLEQMDKKQREYLASLAQCQLDHLIKMNYSKGKGGKASGKGKGGKGQSGGRGERGDVQLVGVEITGAKICHKGTSAPRNKTSGKSIFSKKETNLPSLRAHNITSSSASLFSETHSSQSCETLTVTSKSSSTVHLTPHLSIPASLIRATSSASSPSSSASSIISEEELKKIEQDWMNAKAESKTIEEKLMKVMQRNRTFVYVD